MPTDRPLTDQPTDHSLTEAAVRLGVSPEAVRSRLRRGTLEGERVNGSWRVRLPGDAPGPGRSRPTSDQPTDRLLEVEVMFTAQRAALDHAEQEINWLRGELSARSQELAAERERADTLHRLALHRIEALTDGAPEPTPAPSTERDPGLDAPQGHDVAPSATDVASPTDDSNRGPSKTSRSVFGDWWARLRGL